MDSSVSDCAGKASPTQAPWDSRLAHADLLVLVVEDDASLRCALSGWLGARNFRVLVAATCADGIDIALSRRPHVILLDLRLPDASGLQLVRTLRGHGLAVSFVVLTGSAGPTEGFEAAKYGVSEVIEKPVTADRIASAIRAAAGQTAEFELSESLRRGLDSRDGPDKDRPQIALAGIARVLSSPRTNLFEFRLLTQVMREGASGGGSVGQALDRVQTELRLAALRAGDPMLMLVDAVKFSAAGSRALTGSLSREGRRQLVTSTGLHISGWHRLARLRLAVQELARTQEPVAQIAYAIGFPQAGQLSRDLRVLLGVSPKSFRQLLRQSR